MKRWRLLARFLWAFLCFFLVSCTQKETKDLVYLEKASFAAEIEGRICDGKGSETAFAARMEVDRRGEEERYQITYLAPKELEGITVTVIQKKENEERQVTASLGELSVAVSHDSVTGWLLPIEELLSLSEKTPESLQRTTPGYRFVFPAEKILTLDEKGLPISFQSPKISFSVRSVKTLD